MIDNTSTSPKPELSVENHTEVRITPYYQNAGITIYNARAEDVILALPKVRCVVTSPPFNQSIDAFSPSGMHRETRWVGKISGGYSDQVEEVEYQKHQRDVINMLASILEPDGSLFYNHKIRWRDGNLLHPVSWLSGVNLQLRQEIVWARNGSVTLNARMFAPSDERIYWFDNGKHCWNQDSVSHMTVWHIAQFGSFGTARGGVTGHPCAFPTEIPLRCIKATSAEGDLVLDPYMGSGTTLIAAKKLNRRAIGIEVNERYCELAVTRLSQDVLDFSAAPETEGINQGIK